MYFFELVPLFFVIAYLLYFTSLKKYYRYVIGNTLYIKCHTHLIKIKTTLHQKLTFN